MDNNNVYNVNSEDVKDVGEVVEPVEAVEAEVVSENKSEKVDLKGMIYSVVSLLLGVYTAGSLLAFDYSFILCVITTVGSCVLGIKYISAGYKKNVFGTLACLGMLLAILGILLGIGRLVLACIASVGVAFLKVLF